MRVLIVVICLFFINSVNLVFAQTIDPFMDYYKFREQAKGAQANDYQGIDGNPYLNKEFVEGECHLKDSSSIKLMLRYNIYSDAMEYKEKDKNQVLAIGNTALIDKIILNDAKFVFLPFGEKGGYFEILVVGKCALAQKRIVKFKEAEAAKPIEGISKPARFVAESDVFYIVSNQSTAAKISNIKSVIAALKDQESKIESYIDQEKIKNTKKENLVKIVNYYNSL